MNYEKTPQQMAQKTQQILDDLEFRRHIYELNKKAEAEAAYYQYPYSTLPYTFYKKNLPEQYR